MKKILMTLALMFVAMLSLQAFGVTPKKVAVYVEGNISKSQKSAVNSAAMGRISGNKEFVCYERNEVFLNALTKEEDYQVSGEVPVEEIREIGSKLGVDYCIVLDVRQMGGETIMAAKLINLVTGQILKTATGTREGNDIKTLKALATNCTYRLISNKSK